MDQRHTLTYARRFRLHWAFLNSLCNLGGLAILLAYLRLSDALTGREVAEVALMWVVFAPFVPLALLGMGLFWLRPSFALMKRAATGTVLTPEAQKRLQRFYFEAPKITGATAFAAWGLAAIAMYAKRGFFVPLHAEGALALLLGAVFVAAPIVMHLTVLLNEAHLRKLAHVIFPDGHLSQAPGRSLSFQQRMATIFLLSGLAPLMLLAFAAYGRARGIVGSPNPADALRDLLQMEALVVGTGVVLIVAVAAITTRTVGLPLTRLAKAMRQVEEGDFSAHVRVETNDLLGYLSERFNAMVEKIREHEFLHIAFGRYVSQQVADAVLAGKIELGGERRVVSVLFSDIRHFTSLSETMTPREIVDLLNRYYVRMVAAITAEGGMVNKFMGDGMMALFGAPVENPDHAVQAVRAARAMVQALEAFNAEQRALGEPELSIGIGIATGEVVVGNIGSEDRLEYTAIGDTVNTASRIEGLTKQMDEQVLVDAETCQRASSEFAFEPLGAQSVKGKAAQVEVYALRLPQHA